MTDLRTLAEMATNGPWYSLAMPKGEGAAAFGVFYVHSAGGGYPGAHQSGRLVPGPVACVRCGPVWLSSAPARHLPALVDRPAWRMGEPDRGLRLPRPDCDAVAVSRRARHRGRQGAQRLAVARHLASAPSGRVTRDDRKYVRVFYDLPRDYPAVYANDAALAAWLRLLMLAEAIWPVRGTLPRGIKPAGLRTLTDVGLVELLPGHQFLIKGQDGERTARRTAASNAAALRWQKSGNADPLPSRAEQSNTEQRLDRAVEDRSRTTPRLVKPEMEAV